MTETLLGNKINAVVREDTNHGVGTLLGNKINDWFVKTRTTAWGRGPVLFVSPENFQSFTFYALP